MSIFLGLVVMIMIFWQLVKIGWLGWTGLQTVRGVKTRKSSDVSGLQWTPASRTQEIITSLNAIGFHRLGEALSILPYNRYVPVWTLVNKENTVQAEVVFGWMSFSTYFQEDVLVVTDYPSGEHIEMPGYQSHTVSTTINDAYIHHLGEVDKYRQKYGSPITINTMADYFTWETIGRINYGSIKLKNLNSLNKIRLLAFVYAVAILLLIPFINRALYPFNYVELYDHLAHMELLIIGLTYPVLFLPTLFSRWQDRQGYKKTAQAL